MVHNGVEYGIMQAYAEGFSLFDAVEYELDNAKIAHLWMQGSVVRSWLCELAARAFEQEGNDLAGLEPYVEDSGEGRWTVEDAIDKRIPMPVITTSLFERFSSRGQNAFAAKVNAALRNQFGGHAVHADDAVAQSSRTRSSRWPSLSRRTRWWRAWSGCPIHPTTLVIFGGTGDLAHRKLLPAIYNLAHEGALPERFNLIGVSRADIPHDDYRAMARESIEKYSRRKPDEQVLDQLLENVRYVPGTFDDDSVYEQARGAARGVRQGGRHRLQPRSSTSRPRPRSSR